MGIVKGGFSEKVVKFSLKDWGRNFFQTEKEDAENGRIPIKRSWLYLLQPLQTHSLCNSISEKAENLFFVCIKTMFRYTLNLHNLG